MTKINVVFSIVFGLFVSITPASASIVQVPYNGPLLGNSWATAFGWSDPSFDTLAVKWVSGPLMESPAWRSMSGGWGETYNSGDGLLATASGPSTTHLSYAEVWFDDPAPAPGVPSVVDIASFSGTTLIESGRLTIYASGGSQWIWDPTMYWDPSAAEVLPATAAVPEPASLVVWSLLGLVVGASGIVRWRRFLSSRKPVDCIG